MPKIFLTTIAYSLLIWSINAFSLSNQPISPRFDRDFFLEATPTPNDNVTPSTFANLASQRTLQSLKIIAELSSVVYLWNPSRAVADSSVVVEDKSCLEGIYSDKINHFVIIVPPSWSINSRKLPVPKITRYQLEEVLFTATSFGEGSSLGITKSNARSLLQDFGVEYWFAPLNVLQDLGTPDLIAKLLILQRQSEFEKKITTSELVNASFNDKNLDFTFDTPIAEGIYRRTAARTFFRDGYLYTVWISALKNIFEGDYGKTLDNIRSSFLLV